MVVDGVLRLVLGVGTDGQQLRVEDHFLGLGVEVEQIGQRLPRRDDRRQLTARPSVVEVGEVAAQRLVVE